MFKDLVINSSLLISSIYLIDLLLHQPHVQKLKPLYIQLAAGVLSGALGIVMMVFAIRIGSETIIDLRHLATLHAAMSGGMPGALAASAVMTAGRFGINHATPINPSALYGTLGIVTTGVICGLQTRCTLGPWNKWLVMIMSCLAVYTSILVGLLPPLQVARILVHYWAFTFLAGAVTHSFAMYLKRTREIHKQLEEYSTTDFLTGLTNVRQFRTKLDELIRRADKHGVQLSLIVMDVDHFKTINDTYGHTAGDEVLMELSAVLKDCCRSYDVISRNGGEEFSVLLPDCPLEKALDIAESIRRRVEEGLFPLSEGRSLSVTVSAGVSTYPDRAADAASLYVSADKALYRAKREGRNKVCASGRASIRTGQGS